MRHRRPSFRGIGKASGAAIGKLAIKVYECNGCGVQHKGDRPAQCLGCGRLDFTKIDSQTEAARLSQLRLMQRAGIISNLEFQVRFPLMAARADGVAVKVATYIADFVYTRDGKQIIEDAKGAIAPEAELKLRWMAGMGLPVQIVTAKGKHNG